MKSHQQIHRSGLRSVNVATEGRLCLIPPLIKKKLTHISQVFISSCLSSARYGQRSGGFLSHALPCGAYRAADGLRNRPGGKFGSDKIPADRPTVHFSVRPGQRRAAGGAGGQREGATERR